MKKQLLTFATTISIILTSPVWAAPSTALMPANEQAYRTAYAALIKENDVPHTVTLNNQEKVVDRYLSQLKENSRKVTGYRPDRPFYQVVNIHEDKLQKDELWQFLHQMPKGANLHTHYSALLSTPQFYDFCQHQPDLYILTKQYQNYAPGTIVSKSAFNTNTPTDPSILMPFDQAVKTMGKENLLADWSMGPEDANRRPWDAFQELFSTVGAATSNPNAFQEYAKQAFREEAEDGIQQLEIRTSLGSLSKNDTYGLDTGKLILAAYHEVRQSYPDFTVKIILSGGKSKSKSPDSVNKLIAKEIYLQKNLKDDWNKKIPVNFIVGADLVNEEDAGYPLSSYVPYFLKMKDYHPFDLYLHAGESNDPDNKMMMDAYLLGSKRIGHGINLFRYPALLEKIKSRDIGLEVCLLSNQYLGYVPDLRNHPAYGYFKAGVPILLASDDPAFFNVRGLSYDFYVATLSWDLNLADLKQLCFNSVRQAAGSPEEKEQLQQAWEQNWNKFINHMSKYFLSKTNIGFKE